VTAEISDRLLRIENQLNAIAQSTTHIHIGTKQLRKRADTSDDLALMAGYAAWFAVLLVSKVVVSSGIPKAAEDLGKFFNPDRQNQQGLAPMDSTPLQKGDTIGQYTISSGFGPRESPGGVGSTYHQGVDVPLDEGTVLRVPVDATVECDEDSGTGRYARIIPPPQANVPHQFLAGHLSECSPGFYLVGHVSGKSGNTGASTGPHLHWGQKPLEGGDYITPHRGFLERVLGVAQPVAEGGVAMGAAVDPGGEVNQQTINAMFGNFSSLNAPAIIGIGKAEGTLDDSGNPTMIYLGHTDPGNAAWNQGFGSWQASPVSSASEGDRLAFDRLKNNCVPDAIADAKAHGIGLTAGLLAQICDMWIQAPLAATDAIANLKQCQQQGKQGDEAWLCMRVQSYYAPTSGQLQASGFGNDVGALTHDQQRRMDEVSHAMRSFKFSRP
jgi:hypothetical protein